MADLGIIFSGENTPSTDTSHYLQLLPEVCRSVIFGPPCIDIDRTVMKYHISVDCQECYIFPKCAAVRENITILAPPTRHISSVLVDICYIRWSKWMIFLKFYVLYDYHEVW